MEMLPALPPAAAELDSAKIPEAEFAESTPDKIASPPTVTDTFPPAPRPSVNELIVPPPCNVRAPAAKVTLPALPPAPGELELAKMPESVWRSPHLR